MLTIRRGDHSPAAATLLTAGPHAGSIWYTPDTDPGIGPMSGLDALACVEIVAGDPGDLHRAAAILRAQAHWLPPEQSLAQRREADRVDALADPPGQDVPR